MTDAVKIAFEIGDKIADEQGCTLVDVEYVKEGDSNYLRLYIDKPDGVGIDECELFSNAFGEQYDKLDPIAEEYFLEVSSPGVDRILKTEREFNYFKGREVSVKLYAAKNGRKEFDAILVSFNDGTITVNVDDEDVSFLQKEAAYVRLTFRI